MVMSALLAACLLAPQEHAVAAEGVNPAPVARSGIVTVSVPLPRGALPAPAGEARDRVLTARVRAADGAPVVAPALPLLRWPDDSIAVLQVHAQLEVPANGSVTATI